MEYIVALLALGLSVGYAVFIAVNIERGKSWAKEVARAVSMLDPQSVNSYLRYHELEDEPEQPESVEPPDRLAA